MMVTRPRPLPALTSRSVARRHAALHRHPFAPFDLFDLKPRSGLGNTPCVCDLALLSGSVSIPMGAAPAHQGPERGSVLLRNARTHRCAAKFAQAQWYRCIYKPSVAPHRIQSYIVPFDRLRALCSVLLIDSGSIPPPECSCCVLARIIRSSGCLESRCLCFRRQAPPAV